MNEYVKHFFQNEPGELTYEQLKEAIKTAQNQEEKILSVFKWNPSRLWSREGLQQTGILFAPTSSYIRAISVLEDRGKIRKKKRVEGEWGRPVWLYELVCNAK